MRMAARPLPADIFLTHALLPTSLKKHMRMHNHKCKYACAVSQSYIWKFCSKIIG